MEKCDFCSMVPVTHVLPVRSFRMGDCASEGDWAMCRDCARLMFRNDWPAVTMRSVKAFEHKHNRAMSRDEREAVVLLHLRVRLHVHDRMHPA